MIYLSSFKDMKEDIPLPMQSTEYSHFEYLSLFNQRATVEVQNVEKVHVLCFLYPGLCCR